MGNFGKGVIFGAIGVGCLTAVAGAVVFPAMNNTIDTVPQRIESMVRDNLGNGVGNQIFGNRAQDLDSYLADYNLEINFDYEGNDNFTW